MIHISKDAQATAAICSCGQNPWKAQLREATLGMIAGTQSSVLLSGDRGRPHSRETRRQLALTFKELAAWLSNLQLSFLGAWLPEGPSGWTHLLGQEASWEEPFTGLSLESKLWAG